MRQKPQKVQTSRNYFCYGWTKRQFGQRTSAIDSQYCWMHGLWNREPQQTDFPTLCFSSHKTTSPKQIEQIFFSSIILPSSSCRTQKKSVQSGSARWCSSIFSPISRPVTRYTGTCAVEDDCVLSRRARLYKTTAQNIRLIEAMPTNILVITVLSLGP